MSNFSGPGVYEIVPVYAQDKSLNVWGGSKNPGTPIKLYQRMNGGGVQGKDNCVFVIADAGGHNAQPETGDREYFIIAGNSGCYLTYNGAGKAITAELRSPLEQGATRWKLDGSPGNGSFYINHVDADTPVRFNISGSNNASGADLIAYQYETNPNSQFILRVSKR